MKLTLFLLLFAIGYSTAAQDLGGCRKAIIKADSLSKAANLLGSESTYLKAMTVFSHDLLL